jgi:hypothetical protein
MKSLLTSEGKDITKYLQEQITELYDEFSNPQRNIDFLRGEIFALNMFLKEFGLKPVIKTELAKYKEMLE